MAGRAAASGVVAGLYRKPEAPNEHGLPKRPVDEIAVTAAGVVGDFNRYRHEEIADDPDSALLIVPHETLEELAREGWPVRPGDLGENIGSRGIPYARFASGDVAVIGGVHAEITRPCDPCTNLYLLPYVGPQRGPEFLRTMMHRRGWYARVTVPGRIQRGDPIRLA